MSRSKAAGCICIEPSTATARRSTFCSRPRDRPLIGESCRSSKGRGGIGDPVKSIPEPGTERAVVDCATNLEPQIGSVSRPPHLLGFVHAPVDQEVRCTFGDRRPDTQTGTVPFGVVDQPRGLASEIFTTA